MALADNDPAGHVCDGGSGGAAYGLITTINDIASPFEEMVPTADLHHFNLDAPPNQSTLFIVLSMFASFGYVIAACASDSMLVCYTQRERITITRGCQRASARRRWRSHAQYVAT
ncbi:hypothetical protein H257_16043 [Aphanomyces astaci]|uniref:Uncharacterized protein n=1 Tax=Aphanomyces astaci TaxID=112090 RepID=W4FLN1_APHAT|nr:hypothetical protein H257_16043 [Aphanomyces astaci]ETV67806.1 hypothetical protein H257_16043 [Aphanomyces astaci]|eukprot:XP_009842664.1 hypothetical protein H257_16043 [Aphanomyces astaci]